MTQTASSSEYLVLSRGQWDKTASKDDIEAAIAKFYDWYSRNVETGRMKPGSRLSTEIAQVSKAGVKSGAVTDGPFGEAKEIIGGYWIIVAPSLREAAELAAQNPCIPYGLHYEIRPLEAERASAYKATSETPRS
jgi:hypothetical protein